MDWARKWGVVVFFGVIGVWLVVFGFWEYVKPREVKVEILRGDTVSQCHEESCRQGGQVVVDVAGAVEKPAVYKLPTNARIGDALVSAGGLSAAADRVWVGANLNLAQKLADGEKIFIPDKSDKQQTSGSGGQGVSKSVSTKINVNTASVGELDSLEGIGQARAQAIVANRPYSKIEELVSKAKIPSSIYDKIKDQLSVY